MARLRPATSDWTGDMVTRSVLVIEDKAVVSLFLSGILSEFNGAVAASDRRGLALAAQHWSMVDIRLKGEQLNAALADAFAQG